MDTCSHKARAILLIEMGIWVHESGREEGSEGSGGSCTRGTLGRETVTGYSGGVGNAGTDGVRGGPVF